MLLRVTCRGKTFLDHREAVVEDPEIDDYAHFATPRARCEISYEAELSGGEGGAADDPGDADEHGSAPEYAPTFGSKNALAHASCVVPHVQAPAVVARGSPPSGFTCACCGKGAGYTLQMPWNAFATAYRVHGGAHAVACVVAMGSMLAQGATRAALKRLAVCKHVNCLMAMDMLDAAEHGAWIASEKQRPQAERGTARKNQSSSFRKNVDLLRYLYTQTPPILTGRQVSALFEYVVLNSQQIQENEKRFIATAMAVAENPHLFPFQFGDRQSMVDRMARIPRNYALSVILPHILDTELDAFRWSAKGKRLLETASPKSSDALWAIMCDTNSEANGRQREGGRLVHRLASSSEEKGAVFTAAGFKRALARAVKASPKYTLTFSSGGPTLSSVGGRRAAGKRAPRYKVHELLRILSGSERHGSTVARGAIAAPTCGSRQSDSNAHTHERYVAVFLAEGLTLAEATDRAAIFVDRHPVGNAVGKERLRKGKAGSKACHALRPLSAPLAFGYSATSAPTRGARMRLDPAYSNLVPVSKRARS